MSIVLGDGKYVVCKCDDGRVVVMDCPYDPVKGDPWRDVTHDALVVAFWDRVVKLERSVQEKTSECYAAKRKLADMEAHMQQVKAEAAVTPDPKPMTTVHAGINKVVIYGDGTIHVSNSYGSGHISIVGDIIEYKPNERAPNLPYVRPRSFDDINLPCGGEPK